MKTAAKRNLVREMLEEELDRNLRAQAAYAASRDALPKGSVTVKRRGERTYCYLKYREGGKVVTRYVGAGSDAEASARRDAARRKELDALLRQLRAEQAYLEKALALR